MIEVKDFLVREKKVMVFGGSIIVGLYLWMSHYTAYGTLNAFDSFPSHESAGALFIIFGFFGILFKMFDWSYPEWLRVKNSKK